jgi:hypothetical protein
VPHDRRRIVGEDARQRRQVAGGVEHLAHHGAQRLGALGVAVEVAHGRELGAPEPANPGRAQIQTVTRPATWQ